MSIIELITLILVVIAIAAVIVYEIRWLIAVLRQKPVRPGRTAALVHAIFVAGVVSAAYAFFIEPYALEVKHVNIATKKLHQRSFTVVLLTDLHCDIKRRNEENIVRLVNAMDPDVIVFTGDAINAPEALPGFKDVLGRLRARLGKFAVKGNWDVWHWKGTDLFGATGFSELSGRSVVVRKEDEALSLTGFNAGQDIDLNVLRQIPPGIFSVFLYHYPGINEGIGDASADLFLSGHTHGGQVALPFYGALVTLSQYGKKYEAGLYKLKGDSSLYVSRGVGLEGGFAPRIRFFARPEITVFHIIPER
jgi:predicted MPP superfamily phosphohydrolase